MNRARRVDTVMGFTVIEVMIAVVVLTVVAVSLGMITRQVTAVMGRSRLELGAAAFLMTEAARLRETPWDSLTNGSRTRGDSVATWTVSDSAGVRRILLVTGYTGTLIAVDSALIVRRRSP